MRTKATCCTRCGCNKVFRRRRCYSCYTAYAEQVRATRATQQRQREDDGDVGPSEEELDRMIAEQLRPENLPEWWDSEYGVSDD